MSYPFTGPEGGKLAKELEAIVGVANKSICTIAPWRGVSAKNTKLEKAIQQIQGYCLRYFGAIDTSLQTAQDSYSLSGDIIDLCDYLADSETDQNELQEFVAGIQRNVKKACEVSTKTLSRFEEARKTLNEMSNKLPKELTTKDGSLARLWGLVTFFGNKDAARRDEELDAAVAELKLEVLDISVLSKSIDSFEKWCRVMDNTMKEAESGVRELSATSGSQQAEKLRKNWMYIQKDYEQYKTQVLKLQDQYSAQVVTHAPDAFSLSELEMNTPHRILNSIVESAYKSMEIIEPWDRASSDHPDLSKMIQDIRNLGLSYCSAIDISIKTAQDGYGFSGDALYLCEELLNPETNVDDLREYIQDMKDKANRAHIDSMEALTRFKDVRKSLNEITYRAPQEIVESDRVKSRITIPSFDRKPDKKRDSGLMDALEELNLAALNLGTLSESVDLFAKWWSEMERIRSNIERNASTLRPGKDKMRVKQLRTNWTRIQGEYSLYKTKIIQLQDYYPSHAQGSGGFPADHVQVVRDHVPQLAKLEDLNATTKVTPPSVSPSRLPLPIRSNPPTGLEDVKSCKEIKGIVDGAFKSLQIIEPWRDAETNHPQLQLVIQKMQAHNVVYFDAIDTSIKTAQDGYSLSVDLADLKEHIAGMQDKAKRAHEDSKLTWDKFRDVRRGLIGITKTIPKEALSNPREGENFVVRLASRIGGKKHEVNIEKALEELNAADLDMNLLDNVDKFTTWWAEMEMVLEKVKQDSQGLKPGENPLRVKQVRKKWREVQVDYWRYKVEIIKLQDHYPSQIAAA